MKTCLTSNVAYPEEPVVGKWHYADDALLKNTILTLLPNASKHILLIDGRSGNGKTMLATKIAAILSASLVHTDDLAWHHHPIDWDQMLTNKIVKPWLADKSITYKPPAWLAMNRPGYIQIAPKPILVVEGVGAGRSTLAKYSSLVVWVQANNQLVYDRAIKRDMKKEGRTHKQANDFWSIWKQQEDPFIATDRPWTRAQLIVNGTPPVNKIKKGTYFTYGPLL